MTTTATATVHALTYSEKQLREGNLDAGLCEGLRDPKGPRVRDARKAYARFRHAFGFKGAAHMLTLPDAQPKLGKSKAYAVGLMLTPARSLSLDVLRVTDAKARPVNACPRASKGCESACLAFAGHGAFNATQKARQVRHAFLIQFPEMAGLLIGAELRSALFQEKAKTDKTDMVEMTFRFNVVSDYRVELIAPEFLKALQSLGIRAYDYTAWPQEAREEIHGYALTYSAKEPEHTSDARLAEILKNGGNVAMPFDTKKGEDLPEFFELAGMAFDVIDGDLSDDRTQDTRGVIVGLRAKGSRGKADASGFVRQVR